MLGGSYRLSMDGNIPEYEVQINGFESIEIILTQTIEELTL